MPIVRVSPPSTGDAFPSALDRLSQQSQDLLTHGDPLARYSRQGRPEESPSWGQTWRAYVGTGLVQDAADVLIGPSPAPQRDFNPFTFIREREWLREDERVRILTERGQFDGSFSEDEFNWDLFTGLRFLEDVQTIGRASTAKTLASMAGTMLGDPTNLIPIGLGANVLRKGATAARTARVAATLGATSLGLEKLHNLAQPASNDPGLWNEAIAGGMGAGIGAGLGLLTSPAFKAAAARYIGTRKLQALRREFDKMLSEPIPRAADSATVGTDAQLASATLGDEIAAGKSALERALSEDPTDNRVISVLQREGDENAGLLAQLRKKYDDAGKALHVVDHPDQPWHDTVEEVRAIIEHPAMSTDATPADFDAGWADRAFSAVTRRYANLTARVTPGGRMAQTMLARVDDVLRTLSGSAATISRGSAMDPFRFPSGAAAENIKGILEAAKDSTVLSVRGIYARARREGPLTYNGRRIDGRFTGYGQFREAVNDLLRRESARAQGFPVEIPADTSPAIREAAGQVRGYFARMRDELEGVGLLETGPRALARAKEEAKAAETHLADAAARLKRTIDADPDAEYVPDLIDRALSAQDRFTEAAGRLAQVEAAIKGQDAYLPRVFNVQAILADELGFKGKLAAAFRRKDSLVGGRFVADDERPLRPEVLETIRKAEPEEPPAPAGPKDESLADAAKGIEQPMGRARITRLIEKERPGITTLGPTKHGQQALPSIGARVYEEAVLSGDDWFRLLGRVFATERGARRFGLPTGPLAGLDAKRLQVGDRWTIAGEPAVVELIDGQAVTFKVGEEFIDLAGIVIPSGNQDTFTIQLGKLIPADEGSLARAVDQVADSATSNRRPKVEGDLAPSVRNAYRAELRAFYDRNAAAAFDKLTAPKERHGVADALDTDPIKARVLDIDETEVGEFLERDVETILERYSHTTGGRMAVRRAIQLNPQLWADARLRDGTPVTTGGHLLAYLRETTDSLETFTRTLAGRPGNRGKVFNQLVQSVRSLRQRIERDIGAPLDMLEGRSPLGDQGPIYAAASYFGRQALRLSFANKLGSVAWAQLNDIAPITLFMVQRPATVALIPRAILHLRKLPRRDLEVLGLMFDGVTRARALADTDSAALGLGFGHGRTQAVTAAVERGAIATTDAVARIGLLNWITDVSRRVGGGIVIDRAVDLSRRMVAVERAATGGVARATAMGRFGLSQFDAAWLNKIGLNAERAERFQRLIHAHGLDLTDQPLSRVDLVRWLDLEDYKSQAVKPNFADWPMDPTTSEGRANRELFDTLAANLHGEVARSLVVSPGAFDRPIANLRMLGRMFNQFQAFPIAFVNQRLRPMAQMPARHQLWYLMAYVGLGAITDAISNHLSGRRSFDESARLWGENPLGMTYAAVQRSGITTWLGRPMAIADALGIGWSPGNLTGGLPGSAAAQHVQPGRVLTFLGPVAGDLDRAGRVVTELASGRADDRTAYDAAKLAPFQNLIWLRLIHRATRLPVVPEAISAIRERLIARPARP